MKTSEIMSSMIFGDGGASKVEELSTDGGSTDAGKVLVVGDNGKIAASDLTVGEGEVAIDKGLVVNGAAADAKVVGDAITSLNGSLRDLILGASSTATILEGGIYSSNPDGTKNFRLFAKGTSAVFNTESGITYKIKIDGFESTTFRVYGSKVVIDPASISVNNTKVEVIYEALEPTDEYILNVGEYKTIFVYLSGSKPPASGMSVTYTPCKYAEIDDSVAVDGKTWSSAKIRSLIDGIDDGGVFTYKSVATESECSQEVTENYEGFLNMTYEILRASHPEYITREVIGKDASGLYDMYKYEFTPDFYDQIIYVQAGVHPWEPDGYVALYRTLAHVVNDWMGDKDLTYIRWGVKIVCVPVVNVWGTYQPLADRTDKNYNGVDLNTDCIAKTQAETVAVTGLIDSLIDNPLFSFGIDYHTTTNWTYGDYYLTVWTGSLNEFVAKQVLYMLARKNCTERTQAYLTNYGIEPTELRIIRAGDSTAVRTYCAYLRNKGIPSATVEHSDSVWGSKHSSPAMTKAVENYINQLINHVNGKFCSILH